MNVTAEWVQAQADKEEARVSRLLFRRRMAAALAKPWPKDSPHYREPAAKPPSAMADAVAFVSAIHRSRIYQPGQDDELTVTEKAQADALFNGWHEGQCIVVLPDAGPDAVVEGEAEKASLYLGLCKQHTGETIPDELLEKRRADSQQLVAMSHEIAGRLESAGFPAYRTDSYSLHHFYVHSGFLEQIPSFRRVIIVPYIAAMTRSNLLTATEFFVESAPYSRFWTFTSGSRCTVYDVRKRLQAMHRKLSFLNSAQFMKDAGLEIILRSSELGTPEKRDECSTWNTAGEIEQSDGEYWFHPHAHCLVALRKGYIKPGRWKDILKQVWSFWGDNWDEGAEIANVRECLKYVTKPGEMLKLPPDILAELAKQLRRLKLAHPMGILAEQIKARKAAGKKLVRAATPDGPVLREVKNWNQLPPATQEERDRRAAEKLTERLAKAFTRVVSRMLPAIGPAGVKEPRVCIMSNQPLDVAQLRLHPAIAPIIACSADEFQAGRLIRVHTCTSTVLPGLDVSEISSWRPLQTYANGPPGVLSGVDLD